MEMQEYTAPDISRQRVEKIEAHCRKIRSEAIVEGFIALVSSHQSRQRKLNIKPLRKDESGEQTA